MQLAQRRRLATVAQHVVPSGSADNSARIRELEAEVRRLRAEERGDSLPKPLAGVRVLEVANWLAAPVAGAILADMGAAVIKVEAPSGDTMRYGLRQPNEPDAETMREHVSPSAHWPDIPFHQENRGKRSIAVDMADPRGQEVVHKLALDSDVFITNLIPERLEKYRMDPDTIRGLNSGIVYASVSGYGLEGEFMNTPGFDLTAYMAKGGVMGILGEEDDAPVKARAGMGDHPTGLACLSAILSGLLLRQQTGEGTLVETSLLRTATFTMGCDLSVALNDGWQPPFTRPRDTMLVTTNTWQTSDDRWLNLMMPTFMFARYWPRFCRAMGVEELIEDERYNTPAGQVATGRTKELFVRTLPPPPAAVGSSQANPLPRLRRTSSTRCSARSRWRTGCRGWRRSPASSRRSPRSPRSRQTRRLQRRAPSPRSPTHATQTSEW